MTQCCGGDTGPGDFYYRILRGWPGTAMENFGDRLSVDDIWRVVMFVKTIPNETLKEHVVPEPKDYIVWSPPKELLAWVKSRQQIERNDSFAKTQAGRPVHPGGDDASSRASRPATGSPSTAARDAAHARGRRRRHQDDLRRHARPSLGRCSRPRGQASRRDAEGHPSRPFRASNEALARDPRAHARIRPGGACGRLRPRRARGRAVEAG